jgi:hypothetical protein
VLSVLAGSMELALCDSRISLNETSVLELRTRRERRMSVFDRRPEQRHAMSQSTCVTDSLRNNGSCGAGDSLPS